MNDMIDNPEQEGRFLSENYRRPGSSSRSSGIQTCPSIGEVLSLLARVEATA